jgi:NAD(P)H dehydrogenase (quinone)
MTEILVLYYSRWGTTAEMANIIAHGIEDAGAVAKIRTVPDIQTGSEVSSNTSNESGPAFATQEDLKNCDGLALGSPTHFGNMAAPLKYFIDNSSALWFSGALSGKPAGVFTSTSSMHGGMEGTLITMLIPLLHHGMILVGVPSTEAALSQTLTGGTPYGPSRHTGKKQAFSDDEREICRAFGKRLAKTAIVLKNAGIK